MYRGIYAAASGMVASQARLDVIANNMANANTNGFKRDMIAFDEALNRELWAEAGMGAPIGSLGTGPIERLRVTSFERGTITATNNPLDVAIDQERGLFAIGTPTGVRYTRDGSFEMDAQRRIVTKGGDLLLDENMNPIRAPGFGTVEIREDGSVLSNGTFVARIGLHDGVFRKYGDGAYDGSNTTLIRDIKLKPRSIEGSNVDMIESMVQMIEVQRQYELAQKSIQSQDEATQRLIQGLQGT
jgi:flagellar basal-body rod protein FlgG